MHWLRKSSVRVLVVILCVALQMSALIPSAHAFFPILFGAGRIGAFIGAAIPWGMRSAGFAARDPRLATTVAGVGRGLAAAMSRAGHSISTLPWAKTAAYSGIAAVGTPGAAYLIVEGVNWVFTDNPNEVTVERFENGFGPLPTDPSKVPIVSSYTGRVALLDAGVSQGYINVSSTNPDIRSYVVLQVPCGKATGTCAASEPFNNVRLDMTFSQPVSVGEYHWNRAETKSYTQGERYLRQLWVWTAPSGEEIEQQPIYGEKVTETIQIDEALEQLQALSEQTLARPLNDDLLAGLVNASHAAATGELQPNEEQYHPWSPTNPLIRPADVSKVFSDNPSLTRPTVADFVESIAPSTAQDVPLPVPEKYLLVDDGVTPVDPSIPPPAGSVDLGHDPKIGPPELEQIPTGEMILAPLFDWYPGLEGAAFDFPVGECPTINFDVWGRQFVGDTHCVILENNRSTIALLMSIFWTMLGFFIVLRA